ncbi:hypothetical protein V5E97_16740 [Singulisphaera sp. Ch08]|uniref:Histone n=1 Tax=Singulisphaera sp. Ch08 TaxID=3120278 RepID=A0AAU7CR38_9BACT
MSKAKKKSVIEKVGTALESIGEVIVDGAESIKEAGSNAIAGLGAVLPSLSTTPKSSSRAKVKSKASTVQAPRSQGKSATLKTSASKPQALKSTSKPATPKTPAPKVEASTPKSKTVETKASASKIQPSSPKSKSAQPKAPTSKSKSKSEPVLTAPEPKTSSASKAKTPALKTKGTNSKGPEIKPTKAPAKRTTTKKAR